MQAVVSTAEHNVMLQQPAVVMSNKVKANPQVGGKGKGPAGKGKGAKPLNKGKKNVANPSMSKTVTSISPPTNARDKAKNQPMVTATMIQDFVEELQAIEQESFDDGHNSKVNQESDMEQEDSETSMTEDEEQ